MKKYYGRKQEINEIIKMLEADIEMRYDIVIKKHEKP